MNREIIFRGKDLKTGEWVCGDLHTLCDMPHIHTETTSYPFAGRRSFVNSDTIGQYTNLKDKNGKEIYEGDIVCQHEEPYNLDYIGVVIYDSDTASFRIKNHDKRGYLRKYAFIKSEIVNDGNARVPVEYSYEVIGNIYDNPDLIKKE